MSRKTYTGCVYPDPRKTGAEVEWRHDPASGQAFPWDLTRAQMAKLDLVNLPIRLEHADSEHSPYNNEVGRVVNVARDPRTQYTAVEFVFNDTYAGTAARALVDCGKIGDLSLGHHYFPETGDVQAREISLCFNGARAGTQVFKDDGERFNNLLSMATPAGGLAETPVSVTASADAQMPATSNAGAGAAALGVKAPEASNGGEPVAAPARPIDQAAKDAPFQSIGGVENLQSVLGELSGSLSTENQAKMYNIVGDLMRVGKESHDEKTHMKEKIRKDEETNMAMKNHNEAIATHLVQVMVDLYDQTTPGGASPVTQSLKTAAEEQLKANPVMREFMKPIAVCASAIKANQTAVAAQQRLEQEKAEQELQRVQAQVSAYAKQFGELRPFIGDAPVWNSAPAPEPALAPIAVNASGKRARTEGGPQPEKAVPEWLTLEVAKMGQECGSRGYPEQFPPMQF